MGGAEKLPLLATTFVNALEDANYPDIEIYRASEVPITLTTASFRIVKVSRKLFGHINAGCLSQLQLTADGPDLRVSVFSYPFLRVILRDFIYAALSFLFVFVCLPAILLILGGAPRLIRGDFMQWWFFVIGIASLPRQFTEYSQERLKKFRENRQAQLAFIRSAVESSMIKATRDEALRIRERDIIHQK